MLIGNRIIQTGRFKVMHEDRPLSTRFWNIGTRRWYLSIPKPPTKHKAPSLRLGGETVYYLIILRTKPDAARRRKA